MRGSASLGSWDSSTCSVYRSLAFLSRLCCCCACVSTTTTTPSLLLKIFNPLLFIIYRPYFSTLNIYINDYDLSIKAFIFDSLLLSEQLLEMTGDPLPALILLIIVEVLLEFLRVPAGVPGGFLELLTLACLEVIVHLVKVHDNIPSLIVHPTRFSESIIVLFVADTGRSV